MTFQDSPTFFLDLVEAIQDVDRTFSRDDACGLAEEAMDLARDNPRFCDGEIAMTETAILDLTGVEVDL